MNDWFLFYKIGYSQVKGYLGYTPQTCSMTIEAKGTESFLIDPNNLEELTYIAAKFGCTVEVVKLAIETTKTTDRVEIYSWIVDHIFKVHYH